MVYRLGADGRQEVGTPDYADCCPPDLCGINVCSLVMNFVNLLPSGPLWDQAKIDACNRTKLDCNGIALCPPDDGECVSVVSHAVYAAKRLYDVLLGGLAPALYESSPHTAVATLPDWLDRLGWTDCFGSQCRDPAVTGLSAYEIMGPCGPMLCPQDVPKDLECAVNHGIAVALSRLQMGIVKNLEGINWVLEPLGAELFHDPDADCAYPGILTADRRREITIRETSPNIKACPSAACPRSEESVAYDSRTVPASFCSTTLARAWPGVMAAECIARTLLPRNGCIKLVRSATLA